MLSVVLPSRGEATSLPARAVVRWSAIRLRVCRVDEAQIIKDGMESHGQAALHQVLRAITTYEREMLEELRALVEMESPSSEKGLVDFCGAHLREQFERLGCEVTMVAGENFVDHLQMHFPRRAGGTPGTLLEHFDTAYDAGT